MSHNRNTLIIWLAVTVGFIFLTWQFTHNSNATGVVATLSPILYWLVGFLRARGQRAAAANIALAGNETADPESGQRPFEASTGTDDIDECGADLVAQMVCQGRFSLLLRPQIAANLSEQQIETAHNDLDRHMAISPAGDVIVEYKPCDEDEFNRESAKETVYVDAYHLDRRPVTNDDYQKFVDDGGYEQVGLWDTEIWPAVLEFVDETGFSGPKYWSEGQFPPGKARHPVVGVSWYEAYAFARWVGKRLPSDAEWIKSTAWPVAASGTALLQRKFPWGNTMNRKIANVWGTGDETTCDVDDFADGVSVGGAFQLIGNIWEWTSSPYRLNSQADVKLNGPLVSIRGGAFDTYYDSQASCQFQSGDSPMARKHNIGFRCALGICDVLSAYVNLNDVVGVGDDSDCETDYELNEDQYNDDYLPCGIEEEAL